MAIKGINRAAAKFVDRELGGWVRFASDQPRYEFHGAQKATTEGQIDFRTSGGVFSVWSHELVEFTH